MQATTNQLRQKRTQKYLGLFQVLSASVDIHFPLAISFHHFRLGLRIAAVIADQFLQLRDDLLAFGARLKQGLDRVVLVVFENFCLQRTVDMIEHLRVRMVQN